MAISKEEWNRTAWHAAAARHGEKHAAFYSFRRYGAKPTAVLLLVGALGWAAYWLWSAAGRLFSGHAEVTFPTSAWSVFAVLLVASIVTLRPRRFPSSPTAIIIRSALVLLAWLTFLVFLLAHLV